MILADGLKETRTHIFAKNPVEHAQGVTLRFVARAGANAQGTEANLQAEAEMRRRSRAPIVLKHRDNSPITTPPWPGLPR